MVGRRKELDRISALLDEALVGASNHLICIRAPSGYGKTALLEAVIAASERASWFALAGRAFVSQPRAPGSILRRMVDALAHDPSLARYLSGLEGELRAETGAARFELGFARFIEGVRIDRPCVLGFDDAQWLDEQTVAAIRDLLQTPGLRPLVVVLTMTGGYDEPAFGDCSTLNVNLRPLDDEAATHLVRELWPSASAGVVAAIVRRAAGVPFDLIALTQQAEADGAASGAAVSRSAEQIVRASLEALPQEQLEFLQVCALMQDPIDLRIVRRLVADGAALDRMIARSERYLFQEGATLRFRHAAIAATVAASIAAPNVLRRKIIDVALASEAQFPVDFDRIATLAADAGDADREFQALASLAARASAEGAYSSAVAAYERALAVGRPRPEEFLTFFNAYGIALRLAGRWSEARTVLEGAVYEGLRLGIAGLGMLATALLWVIRMEVDTEAARAVYRELCSELSDPRDLGDVLAMGANFAAELSDPADLEAILARISGLPVEPSRYGRTLLCIARATAACGRADFRESARAIGEARSYAENRQSLNRYSVDCFGSWISIKERGWVGARIRFSWLETREDGTLKSQTPPLSALMYAMELATVLDFARGAWPEALAKIGSLNLRGLPASRTRTHLLAVAAAIATLGGRPSPLAELVDDDLARLYQASLWDRAFPLVFWSAAQNYGRNPGAAERLVEPVRHRLERSIGPVDATIFDFPLARALYARSAGDVDLLRALSSPPVRVRSPWDEAQTVLAAGLAAEALGLDAARAQLRRAHALFVALDLGFFAAYAADACGEASVDERALLNALGAVPWGRRQSAAAATVRVGGSKEPSVREREVWELVAEGLSNRDIAARLTLSKRTVEVHVNNLFAKLNVRSRTQLVRSWLAEEPPSPAGRSSG